MSTLESLGQGGPEEGDVNYGLAVLQNLWQDDGRARALFEIKVSVDLVSTIVQLTRYRSPIFKHAVRIMHSFCQDDTRADVLQMDDGISTRLNAVHEGHERIMDTLKKAKGRWQHAEALLAHLEADADAAPEHPTETLPDARALKISGDVCNRLEGGPMGLDFQMCHDAHGTIFAKRQSSSERFVTKWQRCTPTIAVVTV